MGSRGGSRRMAFIFLALSVVAAALATLIIFVVFRSLEMRVQQRTVARQNEFVEIVVASHQLEQGTSLTEEHLATKKIPRTFYLEKMIVDPEIIYGRVPRERILPGEPIRQERLADPKAGAGLNALIPKGQRALQVEMRGAQAVAGFVNPGDYVDVLFTGKNPDEGKKDHTRTLLQSKYVLAVDDRLAMDDAVAGKRGRVAPSVTLALTPVEAQLVTHALRTGEVTLTLRNHVDVTRQEVHGVAPGEFIGAANKRKKVAEVVQKPKGKGQVVSQPAPIPDDPNTVLIIEGAKARTEIDAAEQNDDRPE